MDISCSRKLNTSATTTGGMVEIDGDTISGMSRCMTFDAPNTSTSYFRIWTRPFRLAAPAPHDYRSL